MTRDPGTAAYNLLVCGVGGQGTITFNRLLCAAGARDPAVQAVIGTETRGVAQREGITSGMVRWGLARAGGTEVTHAWLAPKIPAGEVDVVIALEVSEAFRYVPFFNADTLVLLDTRRILPKTVNSVDEINYPPTTILVEKLRGAFPRTRVCPAHAISRHHFGDYRQAAILLFGTLFASNSPERVPVTRQAFEAAIREQFRHPADAVAAFELATRYDWTRECYPD